MPRMKGGAVIEERSPLNDAIDYHRELVFTTILSIRNTRGLTYFKEGSPGTFVLRGHARTLVFGRGRHIALEKRLQKKEWRCYRKKGVGEEVEREG